MNKNQSKPNVDQRQKQAAAWIAAVFSVFSLVFLAYSIYIVVAVQNGRFDISDKILMPLTALMLAVSFFSYRLIRLNRQVLAAGLLFVMITLVPSVITVLVLKGFIVTTVAYIVLMGSIVIGLALPRTSRRPAFLAALFTILLTIGIDLWDPPFRVPTAIGGFTNIVIVLAVISLFAFSLQQAWRGNIRVKLVTSFTVIALISVSIVGTVVYISYRNQIREDIRQRLLNIISITALQQDGDLFATIQTVEDMQGDAYQKMEAVNHAILATDLDLAYIFSVRVDEQGNMAFVVDSGLEEGYVPLEVGVAYDDPSALLAENTTTLDRAIVEEDFYTDEYGTFLSAYAPIYRKDGTRAGIVGVDIFASKVLEQEQNVLYLILGTTLGTMVLVTLLGLFLGNLFVGPVINLSAVAKKITEGELSTRATIETTDEVGELAKNFNTMTSQLQETLQGLEQRVADRTQALATSAEVSRRLSTILDLDQLVTEVVEQVKNSFNYYHAHIYLMDEFGKELIMAGGTGEAGKIMLARGHKIPVGKGLVGLAAETKELIRVSDTTADPDWLPNPLLPETKSEIAVPIMLGEKVLGVLDVQQNIQDGLSEGDAILLQSISYQVAVALRNAQVFTETQQQAERETLINEIGRKIQNTASVEQALQVAARELGQALGARDSRAIIDLQSSVITKAN